MTTLLPRPLSVVETSHYSSTVRDAATLLGAYVRDGRTRTDLLKDVAVLVVDLREHFTLDDGRTDWGGRSPRYRAAISEIYTDAHVPADKLDTVQTALRYHVGNVIRERASEADLASVGLGPASPKQRLCRNRVVVAALAVSGSVAAVTNDPLRVFAAAEVLLDFISVDAVALLTGPRAVAARIALEAIVLRASDLLEHLV